MSAPPQKVLLVTERPLLTLTFCGVLEAAGWSSCHILLRPEDLPRELDSGLATLAAIDFDSGVSWDGLRELCGRMPLSRFVVFTAAVTPQLAQEAMAAGVHGLLSIRLPLAEAAQAIRLIWQGERQFRFDGEMEPDLVEQPALTPREQQIVALVAKGRRNREIADALRTTEGSVKVYINRIFSKTGAKSRRELAAVGSGTIRAAGVRHRKQVSPAGSAEAFDGGWMFAPHQSDFRSTGEPSYDSIKR